MTHYVVEEQEKQTERERERAAFFSSEGHASE